MAAEADTPPSGLAKGSHRNPLVIVALISAIAWLPVVRFWARSQIISDRFEYTRLGLQEESEERYVRLIVTRTSLSSKEGRLELNEELTRPRCVFDAQNVFGAPIREGLSWTSKPRPHGHYGFRPRWSWLVDVLAGGVIVVGLIFFAPQARISVSRRGKHGAEDKAGIVQGDLARHNDLTWPCRKGSEPIRG